MLKGISPILTPELLKIIAEMGHGDELVLADGNFPAASIGKRCVRMDGHGGAAVMAGADAPGSRWMTFEDAPLCVMEVPDGMFPGNTAPIWARFQQAADIDLPGAHMEKMEHDAFMDRARAAYAVVQTGETALYGNIIIRKGVVRL